MFDQACLAELRRFGRAKAGKPEPAVLIAYAVLLQRSALSGLFSANRMRVYLRVMPHLTVTSEPKRMHGSSNRPPLASHLIKMPTRVRTDGCVYARSHAPG